MILNQTLIIIVGVFLVISNAQALEGVDYIKFDINGKTYNVPIPNKATREDFRYLKMSLMGDKIAREFLLGGREEKFIFIGDVDAVRWVKLTKESVEVIEYPLKEISENAKRSQKRFKE